MRPIRNLSLAVAVVALVISGCSSKNEGKIEGTKWSSVEATIKGRFLPAGTLTLEFTKDGRVTYVAGGDTYTGTYSLGWGENVTLDLDRKLVDRKKHTEKISIKGDKLTMTDSDGTALTFTRVKGDPTNENPTDENPKEEKPTDG